MYSAGGDLSVATVELHSRVAERYARQSLEEPGRAPGFLFHAIHMLPRQGGIRPAERRLARVLRETGVGTRVADRGLLPISRSRLVRSVRLPIPS